MLRESYEVCETVDLPTITYHACLQPFYLATHVVMLKFTTTASAFCFSK